MLLIRIIRDSRLIVQSAEELPLTVGFLRGSFHAKVWESLCFLTLLFGLSETMSSSLSLHSGFADKYVEFVAGSGEEHELCTDHTILQRHTMQLRRMVSKDSGAFVAPITHESMS